MSKFNLLDVQIEPFIIKPFEEALKGNKAISLNKANPEFMLRTIKDKKFFEAAKESDLNVCDGIGIQWASRFISLRTPKIIFLREVVIVFQFIFTALSIIFFRRFIEKPIFERIPGEDLFRKMMKICEEKNVPVYFFGGEEYVLKKAIERLKIQYPDLVISGHRHGFNYKEEEVIKEINNSKAELVIVALGQPKQEYFINENLDKFKYAKILVAEGGTLDFIAGTFKRAPKYIRSSGLEWLFRLFSNKNKTIGERSRLTRILNAVPVFMFTILVYKLKNK